MGLMRKSGRVCSHCSPAALSKMLTGGSPGGRTQGDHRAEGVRKIQGSQPNTETDTQAHTYWKRKT